MVKEVLLYLLFIAVSSGVRAEVSFDKAKTDSFINAALACRKGKNPGLAASAVKDNRVVFADGYGVADLNDGRKVTNRTLFGIASMSKAFASALMIKLLHERNMSIYTKPGSIMPEGFAYNTSEFTTYATVRDLMTHCLGVPSNQMMRLDDTLTRKDAARRIRYFAPVYKFRMHYLYSNLHYGIVSYLSELLGGQPWERLIQQHIYDPLGMHDSDFLATADRKSKDVSQGYADDEFTGDLVPVPEEVNRQWGTYAGSTGLMSSSADITKWMLMQLGGGRSEVGVQVLAADDLSLTHSPQTAIRSSTVEKKFHQPLAPFTVSESNYAFGWKTGFYKGYKMLRHTGTTFGYSSLITLLPDVNVGVFTTMTGEDESYITRTLLHSHILDSLLGEEPSINETTVCTFPEPWYAASHSLRHPIDQSLPPSRPLDAYTGIYHHIAYGNLTVTVNTTVNQLQMVYGIGRWILYPRNTHDSFTGEAFGLMYRLVDLISGVRFHVHTHSPTTLTVPDFESREPPVFMRTGDVPPKAGVSIVG
ncbi:penicillin-binding protein 4-like [Mya arenaria]|uniref:penicillin-binding protein 4-like n=1 Tax=Mya arenaria TaxID=6604 RepID=UPI0022DF3690|nr:penicillin-binding protein 4-like [Mya arenaria]